MKAVCLCLLVFLLFYKETTQAYKGRISVLRWTQTFCYYIKWHQGKSSNEFLRWMWGCGHVQQSMPPSATKSTFIDRRNPLNTCFFLVTPKRKDKNWGRKSNKFIFGRKNESLQTVKGIVARWQKNHQPDWTHPSLGRGKNKPLATSNEYLVDEETRIVEGEIESLLVWKTLDRGEQNNRKRNHFTSSVFPEGANPPLEGQGITGHSRNVSLTKRVV